MTSTVSSTFLKCSRWLVVCCLLLLSSKLSAQSTFQLDTGFLNQDQAIYFEQISKLDPKRSAMLSAILPGLGQVYNGQAWKVPIIYGGFIAFGHFIKNNHELYHSFRTAYIAETDNRDDTGSLFEENLEGRFTTTSLKRQADQFRRDRDFLVILGTAFYLLNVAEAYIAAHLKEFDINDSLSLKVTPSIQSTPLASNTAGVSVRLNFK